MNITVVGLGYVSLSNAVLLAQHNRVRALEVVPEKVNMINIRRSPISDPELEDYLATKELDLMATTDKSFAYEETEFIIIATPTNYDAAKNYFDTSAVKAVIEDALRYSPKAAIVIKSTIPVGYTKETSEEYHTENILFSPEFLREGHALHDNLYPSRIIVSSQTDKAQTFAN